MISFIIIEYIDNKKIEGNNSVLPHIESKDFELPPSVNTSISQKQSSVKQNTNVSNKSMQNMDNNAIKQEKIKKELHNRIQNSILSRNSKGRTYLGAVSENVANKIKKLFNIETLDRRHVLADNEIRHMLKEHGNV